jgi:Fe-S cluster assembly protein SufD
LLSLFTEQRLKEDWKYTPVEFFRRQWVLGQLREAMADFPVVGSWPFAQQVPPSEDLPALRSLPKPTSPWEVLLASAPAHAHYVVHKQERVLLQPAVAEGLVPLFVTVSVAPHAEAEVWLLPSVQGFLLLRLHIDVGTGGRVRFFYPTDIGEGHLYGIFTAEVAQEARIETYDMTVSALWKRSEMKVRLAGPGAAAYLHGASRIPSRHCVDQAIRIEHAAPHTESNQLFKSLVYAEGRSAFQGRIYVHREGQKTNAYQSHKALLWERSAVAYSRPQLEIFADDVRCTHGVTTGFVQGHMLEYLRVRGMPEAQARQLLAGAFLAEVLGKVPYSALTDELYRRMGFAWD